MEKYLGLPPIGSAHGAEIDHSIGVIHWLMLILFAGWLVFYLTTLFRFRKSAQKKANYTGAKTKLAIYLAGVVAVFELGMLFAVDAPIWARRVTGFPAEHEATTVRIVAEQFAWNIHYPGRDGKFGKTSLDLIDSENPLGLDRTDPDAKDDITTINQFYMPVNKPVLMYLSSKDVIHSLNLPIFRVKQDAIPGMMVPVWFTPVKTTDEIREELKHTFSVAEAMKQASRINLPAVQDITIPSGSSADEMMLTKDYSDNEGNVIAYAGDRLDTTMTTKLSAAGINQVSAFASPALDKSVLMSEVKDNEGNILVAKNDLLSDENIRKLLNSGVKEVSARPASNIDPYVAMEAYNDKEGNPILVKGDYLSEEILSKLSEAGIQEISISLATPTEIACAQLCGLGHYRMRGYMTVQTPEQFQQWFDEQEAALAPPVEETAVQDSSAVQSN